MAELLKQPRPNNLNQAFTSTGYRFRNRSPVIDFMMEQWRKSGWSLTRMAIASNLSAATIKNWDTGKTRQPNHVSVEWFLNALGIQIAGFMPDGTVSTWKMTEKPPLRQPGRTGHGN